MSPSAELQELIRAIPGFPKAGIVFRDITPLLGDADGLRLAVEAVSAPFRDARVDAVAGIESRGFILGAPVALELGCGFVPVRKEGKLPADTVRQEYALEYGRAAIEVHRDALAPGQRVLLVDDLLATGGTMAAACRLMAELGVEIAGLCFLIELVGLNGRAALGEHRVESIIAFD
jgi:adenine phosphoribosyltransferase